MFAGTFIPNSPGQAIVRSEPELPPPVAVCSGRPPLEKVVALNEAARQFGAEVGATKLESEAWENIAFHAHSESLECRLMLRRGSAHSFSPEVGDASPGAALLNLAGLASLLGPLTNIARDLAQRVSAMGPEAIIAVAANRTPLCSQLAVPRDFIPEGRKRSGWEI